MVVIAAIDKSDRAQNILAEAGELATAFDSSLHVVHVMSRKEFINIEQKNLNESGTTVDIDDIRKRASQVASEVIESTDLKAEAIGLVGQPAERVVKYAEKNDAEYIVTAGRKRSPTGKALFGSTAQSIVLNADCPVVISVDQ